MYLTPRSFAKFLPARLKKSSKDNYRRSLYWPLNSTKLTVFLYLLFWENCSLLRAHNVRGKIARHVFASKENVCIRKHNISLQFLFQIFNQIQAVYVCFQGSKPHTTVTALNDLVPIRCVTERPHNIEKRYDNFF